MLAQGFGAFAGAALDRAKQYAMPPVGSERWVLATSFRWVSGSTHSEHPVIADR